MTITAIMSIELEAARAGSIVLYIADHMDEAHVILNAAADSNAPDIASIRRVNGGEQIRYKNGGRVIFISSRNRGHLGYSADVVSVSAHTYSNSDYMVSVMPCMNTQSHARIIIRLV